MVYEKLEVGEKYLTIHLLGSAIKVTAFKNKNKQKPNQPDFTGNGVAIWISEKKSNEDISKKKEELF